ncbi:extensin family protein [Citreimonas salinaria]|uniref:Uncharacterized conserved protein n=1 Tax=Citreimonas salinaria TaxID=321339 RepID=A0A1H3ND17_9RHOB|nr:extensin family protein [Citreimonas salinaria]SDY86817.1 Uncharacterized conserved protein [Citreimonas salinaria]
MRRFLMVAALLAATPLMAQEPSDDAPEPAPIAPPPEFSVPPEARPDDLADPAPDAGEPGFVAEENDVDVVETGPPMPSRVAAEPEARAACRAELESLGVTFKQIDPIRDEGDADCGILAPLDVTGLPGGVALEPAGQMRCDTALSLARWIENHVLAAADRLPERGKLTAIDQGGTYVCRRRNNLPEGELSEHAFGNAVDVMAFRFAEGDPIPVQPRERDGTMAEAFQDAVRATACLQFTTVLGPRSDASHADHLHLDVKDRRNAFRLCQ